MNSLPAIKPRGFIETAIALLLLLALLLNLYNVLGVFTGVFAYAVILSVSFAGTFKSLVRLVGNKKGLAAFIYAVLLIAIIALPFYFIISALSDYAHRAQQWLTDVKVDGVPPLPAWVEGVPFAGKKTAAFWQQLQANPAATLASYEPKIREIIHRLVSGGAGLVGSVLEFVVGIIISAIVLANEQKLLQPLYAIMKKLVGENEAPPLIDATGRAVKGVAVGVMGTAFIAAIAAWIGYAIAGISFAIGLAALTFFLVVIQLGPILVVVPVVIWLFMTGQTGSGIFISIYGLVVLMGIDNVLKPILIARSGRLPILVLFLGVIGGMVLWGFTGMFKGAIVLAVFYTVLHTWLDKKEPVVPASVEPRLDVVV